jgi:hypothetical protein
VVRLDLEKIIIFKDKSKDSNNDNLTNISKPFEPPKPFNEPSKPPKYSTNEPDASNKSDAPKEFNDIKINKEYHSEETTIEKRPDNRKIAGYTVLREED